MSESENICRQIVMAICELHGRMPPTPAGLELQAAIFPFLHKLDAWRLEQRRLGNDPEVG